MQSSTPKPPASAPTTASVQPAAPASPPAPRAPPPAPAAPADPRTTELSASFLKRFPAAKSSFVKPKKFKVTVSAEAAPEAAVFLRDELGFDHILAVSGTDYIAAKEVEVVYFVASLRPGQQDLVAALAERVGRDAPVVPSLVQVWPGAEYHERETFEMLGVKFDGHPDMRGILLPEDWHDIPPLRKDYTSPGR
jgi:NADH:ubiquinone oxidoreductase subunit C